MADLSLSKLLDAAGTVVLHDGVASFAAEPGEDVSGWRRPDGFGPRDAILTITNDGAASVSIAFPTLAVSDGVAVSDRGLLFATSPIVIPAGESLSVAAPRDSLAVGHIWKLTGAMTSGATVEVTVTARALQVVE